MTALADDALMTLDQAAQLIPGFDAEGLKRLARRGKLTVYKPGKAFLTTPAHVREAVGLCRVGQKVQDSGFVPPAKAATPFGLSSTELASAALDLALAQASAKKRKR